MDSARGPHAEGWKDGDPGDPGEETVLNPPRRTPGAAVEELLSELEAETDPRTVLTLGGLRGRIGLVTGGSTGIGRAIALALAQSGTHVAFTYVARDEAEWESARETAETIEGRGVKVLFREVDSCDSHAVRTFVEEVLTEMGGLHILVNNAGIGRDRALWRMSDEEWEAVLGTNLSGAFHYIRAVAPHFRTQEYGKIVNISSVHAYRSEFGLANYAASKAGVLALTRSAALELGPSNVNVNAVAPGYIRTTRLTDNVPAEILDRARERAALGRLGDPQDVAGAVLFLCSEAARHITGTVLPVDGGHLL